MGVQIISELVQKNNRDFPIVDSNNIRGGCYQVNTLDELYNIPTIRLKTGMLAYVLSKDTYYILSSDNKWKLFNAGGAIDTIPIYDQEMLDRLGQDLPNKYITIPNIESDLNGSTTSREIQQTGTYVDILFSAIRKLQSEVARLRNAFNYGIYSYNDTNTAMSKQIVGIQNPDEEPLWCIEPEDLSLVYSLVIGEGHELNPIENVNIETEGILTITGETVWEEEINVTDPKLFLYITSSNTNIKINLTPDKVIDLSKLILPKVDIYNIMICINRVENNNFIYLSITSNSKSLLEGYLNNWNQIQKTPYYITEQYSLQNIYFTDLVLSEFNIYSKYQDFSHQVIPSIPTEDNYKYNVAHITIRSVKNEDILKEIQYQLPNNELIFVENTKKLWIKNNNNLINIGSSGGSTEEGMTQTEVINLLKELGIVREEGKDLQISDIADLTFIHQATGTKFRFTVDSSGNLVSQQVPELEELLSTRIEDSQVQLKNNVRGFIGQLRMAENNISGNINLSITQDAGIYSDRIKIGAFYAPYDTDNVFGCSRAFVELENTADCDFSLEGCYLHYTRPDKDNNQVVYHLPLTGTLKAGSTYLIVGKKYAKSTDANVYINIDSYDQEWFVNRELIDFTIDSNSSLGYGFALTYGNADLTPTTYLQKASDSITLGELGITSGSKFPKIYDPSFIDAICYKNMVKDASNNGYWAGTAVAITSNTMYKNMFELDPAKQAFQSCNTADSSRVRWASTNDIWVMDLSKPTIQFPHSNEIYNISNFTPKASFQNKNVSTDKSKLNTEKPNMVTCSFGKNGSTRCFNWISVGKYDEYLYIREKGKEEWIKFESYKPITEQQSVVSSNNIHRNEYSVDVNNIIYARISGRFPGDGTFYTSHKCIITIESSTTIPKTFEYKVGREGHFSDIQTFVQYPLNYTPVIYQITDQQGFHWIEYQVWAAAAQKLYEKIKADQKTNPNIIPILINTGDMTQNGTRINEWFDYYTAGSVLFKEFEQMNVVGNNDLCGTDVSKLGTGDDQGKSNSFYFHLFYCYDIDESVFTPIVNNKYIPSLYYFDINNYRIVMINSEITSVNCQQWYGLTSGEDIINIYTGYTIGSNKVYHGDFTSIYTMVYNMLTTDKNCIAVCHEMPFTVITNDSITTGQEGKSRSLSTANALIGSHTNQISNTDTGVGTYWLSRLLEYKGVKLCIGGHKHTYACTYPLREYFLFGDGKNSKDNYSEYTMNNTLADDNVTWILNEKDLTKFPLTKREDVGAATTGFYPYTPVPDLEGGVTYFMCQATGYKLTSNKELPSANQKFSLAVPQTSNAGGKDTANNNQKYPMFGIIQLGDTINVKLVRITNIFNNKYKFAQNVYSTSPMTLEYFTQVSENNYGNWTSSESNMLSL